MTNIGDTPLLMLTARDAVENRVEGLESGAFELTSKEIDHFFQRQKDVLTRRGRHACSQICSNSHASLTPDALRSLNSISASAMCASPML